MLEGSLGSQDQPQALHDLFSWYRTLRETPQYRFRSDGDRDFYQDFQRATRTQVLEITPQLFQDIETAKVMNGLVFVDAPVVSFANSPYARIHIAGRKLRRILVADALSEAELVKDVPQVMIDGAKAAYKKMKDWPSLDTPEFDSRTIETMASLPTKFGKLTWGHTWSNLAMGLTAADLLIMRTLAARFNFPKTIGLGYDRTSILLCNKLLEIVEAFSTFTPYQLEARPQEYLAQLHAQTTDLPLKGVDRADKYFRPGGMWSDEMLDKPGVEAWIEVLRTGQAPTKVV